MTRQEDRNGLHVRVVEATVIEQSDVSGAFRQGASVNLELDTNRLGVNVTRGDGKVIIARLRGGPESEQIASYLQEGHTLGGKIEEVMVQPYLTMLRIRLQP